MSAPPIDPQIERRQTASRARRVALLVAPWLAIVAVATGGFFYLRAGGDNTAPAVTGGAPADDAGGVARALAAQGISGEPGSADTANVPGAPTQGFSGDGGHVHDKGKQPTLTQIETMSAAQTLPLFPADTVSAADLPQLKRQVEQARQVAERLGTVEAAKAAGYTNTTSDVPFMGEHYLNFDLVRKGVFDPAHPQGLLFSKVGPGGAEQLVGVWFLLVPGINGIKPDVQPQGFAGNLDLWHAHVGLCLVGLSGASEGETKASCSAKGGSFTPDLRWMMHVWVAPRQDNPDGVFAYLNNDLYQKQQAAAAAANPATGQVR